MSDAVVRPVSLLTIGEAAARLHTTPSTIRSWEQRLGYPTPGRSHSGRRLYDEAEIELLGDALSRGLTISSAIRHIQEQTASHTTPLAQALAELRFERCDQLLEAAISLRGVCRAFDEVVMEAVDELSAQSDDAGVKALAVGWAKDRARWHRRLATTPARANVVMADSSNELSPLRVASEVLALQLRMRGLDVRPLVGAAISEFRSIAELVGAEAVIFVGRPRDAIDRRPIAAPTVTASFHADPVLMRTTTLRLSPEPRLAADELCDSLPHLAATCDGASRSSRSNGAGR